MENLAYTRVGNKIVTCAAIDRCEIIGNFTTYEVFIWSKDENGRLGNILNAAYPRNKREALKIHEYIVRNLTEEAEDIGDCTLQ